jgi:hypothetical protein
MKLFIAFWAAALLNFALAAEAPAWKPVPVADGQPFNVLCSYRATVFHGERVLYAVSVSAHFVDFELDGVRASVPAAKPDQLFVSDGKVINTVLYQRCDER